MKKITIILLILVAFSCNETNNIDKVYTNAPLITYADVVADYNTWWSYHYYNINLSLDFEAIDENSKSITKIHFLEKLTTGKYITIALKSNDGLTYYKLFKLDDNIAKPISTTIKNTSAVMLDFYRMEGNTMPDFEITDLNGVKHSNNTLKGKTTVLKTWFIACKPCVAEFPELNKLVSDYENRKDVQFISLALDADTQLKEFLKKEPFKYAVVGNQKDLIQNQLQLTAYPTHVVIDAEGKILKVLNKASQMISYLESYTNNPANASTIK